MLAAAFPGLLAILAATLGLSRPWVSRLRLDPSETLVAGAALSLIAAWLCAWTLYVSGAPPWLHWMLPAWAAAALALDRRGIRALFRDPGARDLAVGQLIVSASCVAWLAFIRSYSDGTWTGDWFEHWERARFFTLRWPLDHRFIGVYAMTARPPLANLLTSEYVRMTRDDYAHYQVAMAAFSSLAYLPAGLLARRFGGPRAPRILAAMVLASPLFIENATFPWTKLPCAFFVLASACFAPGIDAGASGPPPSVGGDARAPSPATLTARLTLCLTALAAALLTHYSAGPYVLVIGAAFAATAWRHRADAAWRRSAAWAAAAGAALALTWFGWSIATYGPRSTFMDNTSAQGLSSSHGNPAVKIALNIRDTVVPFFLRDMNRELIFQERPAGLFRDEVFELYQVNLPLAFGSLGWLLIAREAARAARGSLPRVRLSWAAAVTAVAAIGIAVHGARDQWGLAHICLQPLVLFGLAFLAARYDRMGTPWRLVLVAGAAIDLCLGVALQFAGRDFAFERWFEPSAGLDRIAATLNRCAWMNLAGKQESHLEFLADLSATPQATVLALICALGAFAVLRARRSPADGAGFKQSPLANF